MQDEQLRDAGMDWEQVRRNGGPPCFHAEADGVLCGRAKQWEGHGVLHAYVSLAEYLRTVRAQVLREAADKCDELAKGEPFANAHIAARNGAMWGLEYAASALRAQAEEGQ